MLIVPFAIEITFSGVYGSRPFANIQHLVWDESTAGRTAARLGDIGTAVTAAFANHLLPAMNEHLVLENTKVQDLDSAGSFTVDISGSGPGQRSSTGLPANAAVLATKIDSHTRGQRPGRTFWCGPCEVDTGSADPNSLDTTGIATWQTAADAFFGDLDGTIGGSTYYPVVLHKSGADLVPYRMIGFTVNAELATQRRRLRG